MKPIDHESVLPIWVITDASDTGVGAWVGQGETADTARPAALLSRKFSNAQMNYGTTDKEALAIVDALTAFHHLLAGNEFTIVTDHQPLMYLKTSRTPTKKQLRWRGYIGQFRTKIIYRPGQWNYLADALSRLYTEDKSYPHTVQDPTQEDSESDTSCNRYRLLFGCEYRLILSMFYFWFRVSFDTQYVLVIVSRYRVILDMFYVTFQGYRFGSLYGYGLQGSG